MTHTHTQHSPVRATITVVPADDLDEEGGSSSLANPFSHDDPDGAAAIHLLAVDHDDDEQKEENEGTSC